MLIFTEHNFVFLESPKAASSSIHRAIAKYATIVFRNHPHVRHFSHRRYEMTIEPMLLKHYWDSPGETSAVIREPMDWMQSWYQFRARPAIDGRPQSTKGVSFEDFAIAFMDKNGAEYGNLGTQAQFLTNKSKKLPDTIWRFDELTGYEAYLSAKLNADISFIKRNASERRDIEISPETKRALMDYFAPDYEIYENARSR